jgi:hypothetical protein
MGELKAAAREAESRAARCHSPGVAVYRGDFCSEIGVLKGRNSREFFASQFGGVRGEAAGQEARRRAGRARSVGAAVFRGDFCSEIGVLKGRSSREFFARPLGGVRGETARQEVWPRAGRARSAGAAVSRGDFCSEIGVLKGRNSREFFASPFWGVRGETARQDF